MRKKSISLYLAVLVAVILTGIIYVVQLNLMTARDSVEFKGNCDLVTKLFEDHLERTTETVRSLQAFYMSSETIKAEEFTLFCERVIKGHDDIRALEWIPLIKDSDKESYEDLIREDGYPNFYIYQKTSSGQKEPAQGREFYYPVSLIYPMKGNRPAHGFDLASNEKRLSAIEKCLSSERSVATAPITLVQDKDSSSAILLFLPVYDKGSVKGLVLAVVETASYLEKNVSKYLENVVHFDLIDQESQILMASNKINQEKYDPFDYDRSLAYGGRVWKLHFDANYKVAYLHPTILVVTGVVASFFIILILYMAKIQNQAYEVGVKVKEQTKVVNKAKEKAELANKAKSSLLANMSHEIRTPMTAILGYVDYLKDNKVDEIELAESFRVIKKNGKHLLSVINDILDLSKIEAEKMTVSSDSVSPYRICEEVFALFSSQNSKSGVELRFKPTFPIPNCLVSDDIRIKQILLNFLSNALKFTKAGFVELRLNYNPAIGQLSFEVEDSGIGMSEEQVKRVFEAFEQANDDIVRKFGGTGLGMMISAKLALLLEAKITVDSHLEKGTTFALNFPLASESIKLIEESECKGTVKHETIQAKLSFKGKVLIVEDNITNQKLLSKVLTKKGIDVKSAYDGEEGVELVNNSDFDLIFHGYADA